MFLQMKIEILSVFPEAFAEYIFSKHEMLSNQSSSFFVVLQSCTAKSW